MVEARSQKLYFFLHFITFILNYSLNIKEIVLLTTTFSVENIFYKS